MPRNHDPADDEPVEFDDAECIRETVMALRVRLDDGRELWVPKSVVHDDSEVFDGYDNATGKLVLARWFADKEGLT